MPDVFDPIDRPSNAVGVIPAFRARLAKFRKDGANEAALLKAGSGGLLSLDVSYWFPYGWDSAQAEDLFELPQSWLNAFASNTNYKIIRPVVRNGQHTTKPNDPAYMYYVAASTAYVRELLTGLFPMRGGSAINRGVNSDASGGVSVPPPDPTTPPSAAERGVTPPPTPPPSNNTTTTTGSGAPIFGGPAQQQTTTGSNAPMFGGPAQQQTSSGGPSLYLPPLPGSNEPANYVRNETPLPGSTTTGSSTQQQQQTTTGTSAINRGVTEDPTPPPANTTTSGSGSATPPPGTTTTNSSNQQQQQQTTTGTSAINRGVTEDPTTPPANTTGGGASTPPPADVTTTGGSDLAQGLTGTDPISENIMAPRVDNTTPAVTATAATSGVVVAAVIGVAAWLLFIGSNK